MVAPSGRIRRIQPTSIRFWPVSVSEPYSPISWPPRGMSTRVPSKPRMSRETRARAGPELVEPSAGLEYRGNQCALGHRRRLVGEHPRGGAGAGDAVLHGLAGSGRGTAVTGGSRSFGTGRIDHQASARSQCARAAWVPVPAAAAYWLAAEHRQEVGAAAWCAGAEAAWRGRTRAAAPAGARGEARHGGI